MIETIRVDLTTSKWTSTYTFEESEDIKSMPAGEKQRIAEVIRRRFEALLMRALYGSDEAPPSPREGATLRLAPRCRTGNYSGDYE